MPCIYIHAPIDGEPATAGEENEGFAAPSNRAAGRAFTAVVFRRFGSQGTGLRLHYRDEYYDAYLRDPNGDKLHVGHRGICDL